MEEPNEETPTTETKQDFDFYFSDPARERQNPNDRGLYPVDVYWIDDGDGPMKLSNCIRCF